MFQDKCKATAARGFTLIELLIVVAIIAILAAIAVPNFLEAQTRAKVSRMKADIRSMTTGIESYIVDNNRLGRTYRPTAAWTRTMINGQFTTPIAYLTSIQQDVFNKTATDVIDNRVLVLWGANDKRDSANNYLGQLDAVRGGTAAATFFANYPDFYNSTTGQYKDASAWLLFSLGPDQLYAVLKPAYPGRFVEYDPTNGTISDGDIIRWR